MGHVPGRPAWAGLGVCMGKIKKRDIGWRVLPTSSGLSQVFTIDRLAGFTQISATKTCI